MDVTLEGSWSSYYSKSVDVGTGKLGVFLISSNISIAKSNDAYYVVHDRISYDSETGKALIEFWIASSGSLTPGSTCKIAIVG